MKTLGDMICRAHHPLELSGRPDGLVVQSDQKEEAVRHTEHIDVIVTATQVVGWLMKRGGKEKETLQRKGKE